METRLKQGVPPGSIVGPILFVFFMHCMSQIRMTIFMLMIPRLRLVQGGRSTMNKMYVRRGKVVTEALGHYKFESEYFLEWGCY